MQLENTFTVPAGIDQAWAAFNDPRQVAPCFPGATLESYEDDSFTGTVKVKLGPISLTYKGKGTFVERDDAAHKVVIEASGRDSRGNGTASATVTGTLTADSDTQTSVTMVTDMTVTGRPAQFGRGVMADISDKIIRQFSACLATKLGAPAESPVAEPAAKPADNVTSAAVPAAPAAAAPAASAALGGVVTVTPELTGPSMNGLVPSKPAPSVAHPTRSEVDAIDLLNTAGAPVLKRLVPAAFILVLLIILRIRRRRKA
jgi:carbon monoxide dehydrogenase subunit G